MAGNGCPRRAFRLIGVLALGFCISSCEQAAPWRADANWVNLDPTHVLDARAPGPTDTIWSTVATQESVSRSATPVQFNSTSAVLRVITRLGELEPGYVPGLVVTNILSRSGSVPLAIVRSEQVRAGVVTVDTTEVQVDPGPLLLYINTAHGLTEWAVTVQTPSGIGLSSSSTRAASAEVS